MTSWTTGSRGTSPRVSGPSRCDGGVRDNSRAIIRQWLMLDRLPAESA
jgi:hypothetical protein